MVYRETDVRSSVTENPYTNSVSYTREIYVRTMEISHESISSVYFRTFGLKPKDHL